MKKYRVIQRRVKCIGCAACKEAAPGRWVISTSDGKATLISSLEKKGNYSVIIDESEIPENLKAMNSCPVRIIEIREM